mmetsp:Transcript_53559/g.125374  ORF Transcript_53559/g.125374 Transcript_53559/m.125374 type:complete len:268 (+) Transcript_53559:684-1487(+)
MHFGFNSLNDICNAFKITRGSKTVRIGCKSFERLDDGRVAMTMHRVGLGHNIWHVLILSIEGIWISLLKFLSHSGGLIDEGALGQHIQEHESHLIELGIFEDAGALPREQPPAWKACPSEEDRHEQDSVVIRHVFATLAQASASVEHPQERHLQESDARHGNHGRHDHIPLGLDVQLIDIHRAYKVTKVSTVELALHSACNPCFAQAEEGEGECDNGIDSIAWDDWCDEDDEFHLHERTRQGIADPPCSVYIANVQEPSNGKQWNAH